MYPQTDMRLKDTKNAGWRYIAVSESDPEILSKRVTDFLNRGWELAGNISSCSYNNAIWHTQPLMKLDPWNVSDN